MRYVDIVENLGADMERNLGRYDPTKDEIHKRNLTDTRKPKLTLRIVNRMKKIRSTRRLEQAQSQDILELVFGDNSSEGHGMM